MQQLTMTASNEMNKTFSSLAANYKTDAASIVRGFYISDDMVVKFGESCFAFNDFSRNINIVPVEERSGDSLFGALGSPVSGRTNVAKSDRETSKLMAQPMPYKTSKVDTDVFVPYSVLNQWVRTKKLKQNYCELIQRRVGLDRLIIGWHGESNSNPDTSASEDPLLRDVNKGWIQVMREHYPQNVLGIDEEGNKLKFGPGGDYENIDQVVVDMVSIIPEIFRENLVCLIGDDLLSYEQRRVYDASNFQTEKQKTADTFQMFGDIPRMSCPGFPSRAIVVTSPDNLSLYVKSETSLRQIEMNPKRERVEDYMTGEIGYVVENAKKFVAVESEGIELIYDDESAPSTETMDHVSAGA